MRKLVVTGMIAAASVASFAAFAPSAEAQFVSSAPNIFMGRDMSSGSTGPDVSQLQGLMIELGYLQVPAGVPLGYYGSLTSSAVAQYQQTLGVPNTGYFGPMTKTAMSAQFASRGWLALLYPSVYGR